MPRSHRARVVHAKRDRRTFWPVAFDLMQWVYLFRRRGCKRLLRVQGKVVWRKSPALKRLCKGLDLPQPFCKEARDYSFVLNARGDVRYEPEPETVPPRSRYIVFIRHNNSGEVRRCPTDGGDTLRGCWLHSFAISTEE